MRSNVEMPAHMVESFEQFLSSRIRIKSCSQSIFESTSGFTGSSASSSNNNTRTAATFGANEALTKVFAKFWPKQIAGVAVDVPAEVTQKTFTVCKWCLGP